MTAKLVLVFAGALALAGCKGSDPTLFPYSADQVRTILSDAKTTLPRRDGPGEIKIWANGRSAKSVTLNMKYASWAPLLECEAVITPVTPKESRVVADCGKSVNNDSSAMARTQDQLRAPMFEEHIAATLNKRPFDRSKVDAKNTAAVFQNLGGMQREALQMSEDVRRKAAESRR